MKNSKIITTVEKYVVPLSSLLGISIIYLYKIGEYLYFRTPIQLIELNPVSTVVVGLGVGVLLSASAYSIATISDGITIKSERVRYFAFLIFGLFLTGMLFLKFLNIHDKINWPAIVFILILSSIAYSVDRYTRRVLTGIENTDSFKKQLSSFSFHTFLFLLFITSVTVTYGYTEAKKNEDRLYLKGTNLVYIGKSDGLMIFKPYNVERQMYDADEIFLISPSGETVLTSKPANSLKK